MSRGRGSTDRPTGFPFSPALFYAYPTTTDPPLLSFGHSVSPSPPTPLFSLSLGVQYVIEFPSGGLSTQLHMQDIFKAE